MFLGAPAEVMPAGGVGGEDFDTMLRAALSPHLVLDNTRTALAFLGNPVTERWP